MRAHDISGSAMRPPAQDEASFGRPLVGLWAASPTAGAVANGIQNLHPAYFAMVMATGIVAIAAHLTGFLLLAKSLTWLNLAAFLVLSAMTVARTILYPHFF